MQQVDVTRRNHARVHHRGTDPLDQARPVLSAHEHEGEGTNLAGLHQGRRLEEFVHCAETARHDDKTLRVLDEHGLARKEVPEVHAAVDPLVHALLVRQLDAQAHGDTACLPRATVRGLHHARATARNDRVAALNQEFADPLSTLVPRFVRARTRGTEHGNGGANLRQGLEPFDELGLDPQNTPGVRVLPVRAVFGLKQRSIGCQARDLVPAQNDGSAAVSFFRGSHGLS